MGSWQDTALKLQWLLFGDFWRAQNRGNAIILTFWTSLYQYHQLWYHSVVGSGRHCVIVVLLHGLFCQCWQEGEVRSQTSSMWSVSWLELSSLLFNMQLLEEDIGRYWVCYHHLADDTQLYISKPSQTSDVVVLWAKDLGGEV